MPGWRKQPKIKVTVPKIQKPKEFWSKDLTALENFAYHGLSADPNAAGDFVHILNETRRSTKPKADLPSRTIHDDIPNVPVSEERSLPSHIPTHRIKQLDELIKRYGENYQKMALDRKFNYMQETPKQLQKNIEVYRRYRERDQKQIDQELEIELQEKTKEQQIKVQLQERVKENMDFDENGEVEVIQKTKRKRTDDPEEQKPKKRQRGKRNKRNKNKGEKRKVELKQTPV
mmetsp:Transcript_170/g.600  ORF Transcript_170/g.600 Transcript_170/m.600 type:complete len:231 (-) Transcript_170:59-751(-)